MCRKSSVWGVEGPNLVQGNREGFPKQGTNHCSVQVEMTQEVEEGFQSQQVRKPLEKITGVFNKLQEPDCLAK